MAWDEGAIQPSLETRTGAPEGRLVGYADALNEALLTAMRCDSGVIVYGQGVTDPGAMFGTTRGLVEEFGKERVFDTPVSEESLTGVAVGAAMNGLRPVHMHNRPDFLLLALNQLVTHAAKMRYMDNGATSVPMVVWSAIGRGWGSGPQHSQAIQGMLIGVPGLKIVMPSTAADAKGLMLSAIEDDDPVVIFEHRWLMRRKGPVPAGAHRVPLGKGVLRETGSDLTIAGASHAIVLAAEAMGALSSDGISADIIDLRTIKPLDEELILESVRKTGRFLAVDTGHKIGGVAAELCALVAEKAHRWLKAPVCRIGLPDVPSPAGFALERCFYPDAATIAETVRRICR